MEKTKKEKEKKLAILTFLSEQLLPPPLPIRVAPAPYIIHKKWQQPEQQKGNKSMQNQRGSAASASSCSACGQIGKARTQTKVHSLHTCVRKHRHVPPPVKEGYRLHVLSRKHNELDTSMNNTHRYNICIQFLPIYQYFITIFHL